MTTPYIPLGDDWQVNAVTPWFPGNVKPVRDGSYEVSCTYVPVITRERFSTRNGWPHQLWSCCKWRGLAQDPKGKP